MSKSNKLTGCEIGDKIRLGRLKKRGVSFAQEYPNLLKEWDYNDNVNIDPNKVTSGSNLKVSWICKYNHKWSAKITNRTGRKSKCPKCNPRTSDLEIFVYSELYYIFNKEVKWQYKMNGYECDVFLPKLNVVIEIDGGYWHRDRLLPDLKKNTFFNIKKHHSH